MDGRLDGATLRFGANRAKPPRGWALFTLRSVRRIFPAVQEVNCPGGAREATLECAAGKMIQLLSAVGHDDPPSRPPSPAGSPTTQSRCQNYQAINTLVSPKSRDLWMTLRTPPWPPIPRPNVLRNGPRTLGMVSKGRAEALPLVVSRGSRGVIRNPPGNLSWEVRGDILLI